MSRASFRLYQGSIEANLADGTARFNDRRVAPTLTAIAWRWNQALDHPNNTTYYSDGTHPTTLMESIIAHQLIALIGK
jgi:hypothetical protein